MSFIGGMGVASGPANPLRFGTRGRIQGSVGSSINYPSPFFDIAHTYLPTTVKAMFRWCRYYFLTMPLINATVCKLSEYPVTDMVFDHESPEMVTKYSEYFQDHLRYRSFMVEVGLDFFTYGNAFVSVGYPFIKYLTCTSCGWIEQAKKSRDHWTFTSYSFRLACPKCGMTGDAHVKDMSLKNASGVKLVRWNPEDIEISYNDITGNYSYFYTIPGSIRNDIVVGRKEIVEDTPQIFIQALKEQKSIMFSNEKLFHMRRPTLATTDRGWGIPLLLPVLKDTFYLQIMKKAQEAILLEHIVPLRILFPQAASGAADPFTSINLADWRDHVGMEIARWRMDPNYIPILPLPIGNQTIGGDGKALLMTGEMQQVGETIMMGMGVPREFLVGGMSYAGTNVSMRMLENSFLSYMMRHKELLRFVIQEVGSFLDWPAIKARFKPFKMADDIQRKSFLLQLNQAQKISDTTLLAESDLDSKKEDELMVSETKARAPALEDQQLAMAEIQGKASVIMAKYTAKAQQEQQKAMTAAVAPGEPGGVDQGLQAGGGTPGGQTAQTPAEGPPGAPEGAPMGAPQQMPGAPGDPAAMGLPMATPNQEFTSMISSRLNNSQNMQANGTASIDLTALASMHAQQLAKLDPVDQQVGIQNLRAQSPELADMVIQLLKKMTGGNAQAGGQPGGQTGVDMRPLPEQRAPRRATGIV